MRNVCANGFQSSLNSGASAGARRSTGRGSPAEFADHRPYYPGDDVRRIDWNAYARLEELVLRLFVAEEDLSLYLLVDTSASLGEPREKLDVAKHVAAGLGYVALTGSDRVSVWPFADRLRAPTAPVRGKKRVGALLRALDALAPSGETDLARAVDELCARRPRPGLVAVISDFLDPAGYQRPIDRPLAERHEPVLLHVVHPEELDPTPGGDFVLVDAERGTSLEVSLDERSLRAYRARVRAFLDELAAFAKRRGLYYGRVSTAEDFEATLLRYLGAAPRAGQA